MDINRRSVLLGISTAGIGVGAAFGSGAFTSVEAARTVDINTTDDTGAILGFAANSPGGDNVIATENVGGQSRTLIKLEQANINEQATTTFENALTVTNNGGQDVGLSIDSAQSSDPNGLVGSVLDITVSGVGSIVDSPDNLASGDSVTLTVVIDLRGANTGSDISTITDVVFDARAGDFA